MGTAAGLIAVGFGHEAGKVTLLPRQFLHHEAKEGEAIGHGQGIAIGEVGLELALGVFVVKGVDIPTQTVHGADDAIEDFVVVQKGR